MTRRKRRTRRTLRNSFSAKTVFVFVFVVVLAAAVISTSTPSGGLIIKRVGYGTDIYTPYQNTCLDTDANNPNYKQLIGETYIEQTIGNSKTVLKREYDTCLTGTTLHEFYCIGNIIYGKTEFCKEGCANGACNPCLNCEEVTASCKDTDGGKLFYTTGVVSDVTGNHIDTCINTAKGTYVREGYCLNGKYAWEWKLCPADCYNGACLTG